MSWAPSDDDGLCDLCGDCAAPELPADQQVEGLHRVCQACIDDGTLDEERMTVPGAIERSVWSGKTTRIAYQGDRYEQLLSACSDMNDMGHGTVGFYGVSADGSEWRVELVGDELEDAS